MKLLEQTYNIQESLGNYCKTGLKANIPGLTPGRINHYRRLVYNGVKNTLEQAFPISLQVLGDEFEQMIHQFFSNHNCETPQIWKLPGEFYEYSKSENFNEKYNKPWLSDLFLFEWIEIEVHTMPDIKLPEANHEGDLLNEILIINPEHKLIQLNYPVHLKHYTNLENHKGQYYVLVSRHPENGKVFFFNLSTLHAWIFTAISGNKRSVKSLYPEIHKNFGIESETVLSNYMKIFLSDLHKNQVILGTAL